MESETLLRALPEGLLALLKVLRDDEYLTLTLRHFPGEPTRPIAQLRIFTPPESPSARVSMLRTQLDQLVRTHFPHHVMPVLDVPAPEALPCRITLAPEHPLDWTQQPLGPRLVKEERNHRPRSLSPRHLAGGLALQAPAHLLLALRALNQQKGDIAITFGFAPFRLQAQEILQLREWLATLENDPVHELSEQELIREVRAMLAHGRGYRLLCHLQAEAAVDHVIADHLCQAFYGCGHDPAAQPANPPTWSASVMLLRGLLPACGAMMLWGRHGRRPAPRAEDAIVIGHDRDGHELPLSLRDRARHTYIIGNTGTGKSTLMLNMALQDMEAGRCVILFDPHGDLWEHMRRIVPASRREDLQLHHLSDPRWPLSFNVFAGVHDSRREDANIIVNSLYDLFRRNLYKNVPEAFGPLFETLFRYSLMLLIMADHPELTLAHINLLLMNRNFREWLLERANDRDLNIFWKKIFPNLCGEWSNVNLSLYVLSKLNIILQNPRLKPVFTQTQNTLSFRDVIADRRICLINFAKGDVGARDAGFVAGVLSLRLAMASMAQARLPDEERKAACVYMDEFQNYASYILGDMLAETRKYGLHITLAHQTLGQIDDRRAIDDLRQDVLANTANKFIFRVGRMDAQALEHFVAPHFDAPTLSAIDDHTMIAVALDQGQIREPALIRTSPPPSPGEVNDPPLPLPPAPRPRPDSAEDPLPDFDDDDDDDDDDSLLSLLR
jgi:hypothetical protein